VLTKVEGMSPKPPNKYGIYTQGESIDELIANMKEAVARHYDDEELPKSFAWQMTTR
jgi:predicted RNase H-like HicB family nuclease